MYSTLKAVIFRYIYKCRVCVSWLHTNVPALMYLPCVGFGVAWSATTVLGSLGSSTLVPAWKVSSRGHDVLSIGYSIGSRGHRESFAHTVLPFMFAILRTPSSCPGACCPRLTLPRHTYIGRCIGMHHTTPNTENTYAIVLCTEVSRWVQMHGSEQLVLMEEPNVLLFALLNIEGMGTGLKIKTPWWELQILG